MVSKSKITVTENRVAEQSKRLKKLPLDEDAAQYPKEANEFVDEVERLIRVQLASSFTNVQVPSEAKSTGGHLNTFSGSSAYSFFEPCVTVKGVSLG